MSKMKLNTQDFERIMYWNHLAFKKKKPSNEDGETLKKILLCAECNIELVQEQVTSYDPFWFEDE